MKHLVTCLFVLFSAVGFVAEAGEDLRPPLDKSDYQKTVWSHVNPWFPFDKNPIYDLGGPNVAWQKYYGDNIWGQGFLLLDEYGLDGLQVEINEPASWGGHYRAMLNEAKAVGSKIRLGMFFGCYSEKAEQSLENMIKILGEFREDFKTHPNMMRIGERPVIAIYNPTKYQPEQWKMIFEGLDREFGTPFVYLTCQMSEEDMRRYLPVFDGVTSYGGEGIHKQRIAAEMLGRVMKQEFPQKIFEGAVHSTYTNHFHMGGLEVDLSRYYRESFDVWIDKAPDAIQITNLFDHYENSLIFPCYEREDFMLRYMQYRIAKWRGNPFPAMKTPELVVTNHTQILLGHHDLKFEVMGFPIDAEQKEVLIQLDICNTAGEVLRSFPEKQLILDDFRVERFSVPSTDFASERGVVPRLSYTWNGSKYNMNYNPMTLISPSICSYRMYWARSTKNALQTQGEDYWTINDVGPGETSVPDGSGISIFTGNREQTWVGGELSGCLHKVIKRDGVDFYFTNSNGNCLKSELALNTPPPGQALHWYYLEMENRHGRKWQSLPIWETDGTRAKDVMIPIPQQDGSVVDYPIEGARVPYFYYPCREDHHRLLLDVSGYMHHGSINGAGYGGGHLGYTGYNYNHNGPVGISGMANQPSLFMRDSSGGFLRFSGKDHVTIMGSTAFPGASTYELSVRPAKLGEVMGLIGSGNNQISLCMLPDGKVQVQRRTANEGMGGASPKTLFENTIVSNRQLEIGKWTRLAVVYDCRKLQLYMDGQLEGEVASAPTVEHEWINHLLIGALNKWVWDPIANFQGDIRQIRIYGRNLSPDEFLKDDLKN